jgi:putative sigma-54 modulation protein
MDLEIKTRHFTLDDEARELIDAQFEKLERFAPRPVSVTRLQINFENNVFHCDGVLHLKHQEFRAENTGAEPALATQGVAENLQRQLEKFKGKVSAKQRGEAGGLGANLPPEQPSVFFETENFEMHDMDPIAARAAFTDSEAPFLVFRNTDTGKIGVVYRRSDGELGMMEATG